MQAIITKFLGPTYKLGARIKVTGCKGSMTFSYNSHCPYPHNYAFGEYLKWLRDETGYHYEEVANGKNPDGSGYTFIVK